jgi:hypothetical protein
MSRDSTSTRASPPRLLAGGGELEPVLGAVPQGQAHRAAVVVAAGGGGLDGVDDGARRLARHDLREVLADELGGGGDEEIVRLANTFT